MVYNWHWRPNNYNQKAARSRPQHRPATWLYLSRGMDSHWEKCFFHLSRGIDFLVLNLLNWISSFTHTWIYAKKVMNMNNIEKFPNHSIVQMLLLWPVTVLSQFTCWCYVVTPVLSSPSVMSEHQVLLLLLSISLQKYPKLRCSSSIVQLNCCTFVNRPLE